MHYYHLVCSIVILSYIQKIYLLLFYCYFQQYFICIIIYFISIIIPQTPCHRIISLFSNKLYIDISRSSVLSINVLLIFDTYQGNGALFLTFIVLFLLLSLSSPQTVVVPFKTIYASLQSHKFDLSIEVLSLIFFVNRILRT